jgi:hypothetical protein
MRTLAILLVNVLTSSALNWGLFCACGIFKTVWWYFNNVCCSCKFTVWSHQRY